jgi:hypothetical protein
VSWATLVRGGLIRGASFDSVNPKENIQLLSDKKAPSNIFYSYPEIVKPLFAKGIQMAPLDIPNCKTMVFDTTKDQIYDFVMSK